MDGWVTILSLSILSFWAHHLFRCEVLVSGRSVYISTWDPFWGLELAPQRSHKVAGEMRLEVSGCLAFLAHLKKTRKKGTYFLWLVQRFLLFFEEFDSTGFIPVGSYKLVEWDGIFWVFFDLSAVKWRWAIQRTQTDHEKMLQPWLHLDVFDATFSA